MSICTRQEYAVFLHRMLISLAIVLYSTTMMQTIAHHFLYIYAISCNFPLLFGYFCLLYATLLYSTFMVYHCLFIKRILNYILKEICSLFFLFPSLSFFMGHAADEFKPIVNPEPNPINNIRQ